MATASTTPSLSWDYCPEELLRIIFKQLSLQCLVSCMTVNRRWKDIVLDFIEFHSLWPKIVSETIANKGLSYQRKSLLSFKDMLMNSLLWPFIQQAKIKHHYTYAVQNINAIHVYKENLILLAGLRTDTRVKYFNITTMEQQKSLKTTGNPFDYTENDYMVVSFGTDFCAYGKMAPDDTSINKNLIYVMDDVYLFRLEDNICYLLTHRNVVYALIWNRHHWDIKARGRYYGNANDRIRAINVFDGKVCMVTTLGYLVCENLELRSFHKVNSSNSVAHLKNSSVLVLFNEIDLSVAVDNSLRRLEIFKEFKSNFIAFKCRGMTCAIEHGEMIFIGYTDGAVAICTIHKMPFTRGEPDRLLYVQDLDNTIHDPQILGLEVFEDKLSHHLFIATRHRVFQLLITYPDDVTAYYE